MRVPEIRRRLHADQAGLGYSVPISERRLYEMIREHRERHGPPPESLPDRIDADSIAALKRRAIAVASREIDAMERRAKGRMGLQQAKILQQLYRMLDDAAKRERIAERNRRSPARARESGAPDTSAGSQETAVERLEREEREAAAAARGEAAAADGAATEQ